MSIIKVKLRKEEKVLDDNEILRLKKEQEEKERILNIQMHYMEKFNSSSENAKQILGILPLPITLIEPLEKPKAKRGARKKTEEAPAEQIELHTEMPDNYSIIVENIPRKLIGVETMNLFQILEYYPPQGWEEPIKNKEGHLREVALRLEQQPFLPEKGNVFRIFYSLRPEQIKVVILGQDPYPTMEQNGTIHANGFSFSVDRGVRIPPSLKNVFTEIKEEYNDFITPNYGDLTVWVKQGVFLFNSCLTVQPGRAGSHQEIWSSFTEEVLKYIKKINPNVIFVGWGVKATSMLECVKGSYILTAGHPSSLNVSRINKFAGCGHFRILNQRLLELGQNMINWQIE